MSTIYDRIRARRLELGLTAEDLAQQLGYKDKSSISKIENGEEYLPLLFKDEVKNYLFRRGVNAVTLLRSLEAKGICVQYAE